MLIAFISWCYWCCICRIWININLLNYICCCDDLLPYNRESNSQCFLMRILHWWNDDQLVWRGLNYTSTLGMKLMLLLGQGRRKESSVFLYRVYYCACPMLYWERNEINRYLFMGKVESSVLSLHMYCDCALPLLFLLRQWLAGDGLSHCTLSIKES